MFAAAVVEGYDCLLGIAKYLGKEYGEIDFIDAYEVSDDKLLVTTDHGRFLCESFEDADANIFLKIYPVVGERGKGE